MIGIALGVEHVGAEKGDAYREKRCRLGRAHVRFSVENATRLFATTWAATRLRYNVTDAAPGRRWFASMVTRLTNFPLVFFAISLIVLWSASTLGARLSNRVGETRD